MTEVEVSLIMVAHEVVKSHRSSNYHFLAFNYVIWHLEYNFLLYLPYSKCFLYAITLGRMNLVKKKFRSIWDGAFVKVRDMIPLSFL